MGEMGFVYRPHAEHRIVDAARLIIIIILDEQAQTVIIQIFGNHAQMHVRAVAVLVHVVDVTVERPIDGTHLLQRDVRHHEILLHLAG